MVTSRPLYNGAFQLYNHKRPPISRVNVCPDGEGTLSILIPSDDGNVSYIGDMPVVLGESNDEMWERIMVRGGTRPIPRHVRLGHQPTMLSLEQQEG